MTVILARDPDPDPALADALTRILTTESCPAYLREAAVPWLAARP